MLDLLNNLFSLHMRPKPDCQRQQRNETVTCGSMEPNKCRTIRYGVSICCMRYPQWCILMILTTKPQKPCRKQFGYLLLFPRYLCLSKANTLHHTQTHKQTQMQRNLMNIAEQQAITHTSFIFLCSFSFIAHVTAADTDSDAPTCESSLTRSLSNGRQHLTYSQYSTGQLKLTHHPIFCLYRCDSRRPGCELTPSCFSRLPCERWAPVLCSTLTTFTHVCKYT